MPKFQCYHCGYIKDRTGKCPKCGEPRRNGRPKVKGRIRFVSSVPVRNTPPY